MALSLKLESSWVGWRRRREAGREPHIRRLIMSNKSFPLPVQNFVSEIDLVHEGTFKKIHPSLSENTYFFSHAVNEGGVSRRVPRQKIAIFPNSISLKRMIGETMRKNITRFLRKRKPLWAIARITFPMMKAETLQTLRSFFTLSSAGISHKGRLVSLDDLDDLCGDGWDALVFQDGFYTFVTSFGFSVCSTDAFTFKFTISVREGFTPHYRNFSSQVFH